MKLSSKDLKHTLLNYAGTKKWIGLLCSKCLIMKEVVAHSKILDCKNRKGIQSIGKYLFEMKCKWEKH